MTPTNAKLRTIISALETEYNELIRSNTSTLKEMQRIDEIEQSIPYVREWKWELVRKRLMQPERSETAKDYRRCTTPNRKHN